MALRGGHRSEFPAYRMKNAFLRKAVVFRCIRFDLSEIYSCYTRVRTSTGMFIQFGMYVSSNEHINLLLFEHFRVRVLDAYDAMRGFQSSIISLRKYFFILEYIALVE